MTLEAVVILMIMYYVVTKDSNIVSLIWDACVFVCYSYQMQDWEGKLLAEANAKKHTLPSFFPITYRYPVLHDWGAVSKVCTLMQLC